MAGFPNRRPVFNLADPQRDPPPDKNLGPHQGRPVYQNAVAYPVNGVHGQHPYQPRPVFVPPPSTQYTTVPEIRYHGLAVASAADMSYAGYPPPAGVAIPSVFQVPPPDNFLPPNGFLLPDYIPPRSLGTPMSTSNIGLSASAPTVGMGEWLSQRAPPAIGNGTRSTGVGADMVKKTRQQFSACTACRLRRVKCDLKDLRAEWEKLHGKRRPSPMESEPSRREQDDLDALPDGEKKKGKLPAKVVEKPNLSAISNKEDIQCTNCFHREVKCVYVSDSALDYILESLTLGFVSDEFAHRKPKRPRAVPFDLSANGVHSDLSNDGSSNSQLGQLAAHAKIIAPPHAETSAGMEEIHLHPGDSRSVPTRPGLPREWSGFSTASDPYTYMDEDPVPMFPAEAPWIEEDPSAFQQSNIGDVIAIEQGTSALANQGISDSIVLEQSMVDYLFASPKDSSKDAMTSSLLDDFNRAIASDPSSNSASTPRSHSSRGRSRGTSHSQPSSRSDFRIPDLKPSFFESDFYRRFHIQRKCLFFTSSAGNAEDQSFET